MNRQKKKKKRRHTLNDSRESSRQIQIAAAVAATASASNSMIIRNGIVNSTSSSESPVKHVESRKISSKYNECLFLRCGPAMRRCPMPSPITITTIKSLFVNLFDLSASVLAHDSSWQLFLLDSDSWIPMEDISMVHDHCTLLLVNPAELASVAITGSEQLNKTQQQPRVNGLISPKATSPVGMVDHTSQPEDHHDGGLMNGDIRPEDDSEQQPADETGLQSHSCSSVSDTRSSTGDMLSSTHSLQPSSTSADSSTHSLQPSSTTGDSSASSLKPNNTSSAESSTHSLRPTSTSAQQSSGSAHSLQQSSGSAHSLQQSSGSAHSLQQNSGSAHSLQPSSTSRHSSSHSLRRSTIDMLSTAHSLQESAEQLKVTLAAIRSEHLLRAAEFKYDMAITRGSIKGAIASFIRNQGAQCRDSHSFRHKRLELDPAKEAYIHSSREVLKDLNVLQLLVEEMRIDAVERRCRVKNDELEALAPAVQATLTNIARLRAQYPTLERSLREVMKYELEVIVQEEKFTEKEMSNIEYALENCKTLAQTMQTLLQFSNIQDKRVTKPPVVVVTGQPKDNSTSMTALMDSVGAICPNHESRMRALDYSELVQKRRKQLHNFKKEIWTFEGMLHQKRKQLRHVNSIKAIDRQRQMKLKAMFMEDKVNMDIGQERIRKLVQEKRRYESREKGTDDHSSEEKKKDTIPSSGAGKESMAETSRIAATRQTPERVTQLDAEGSMSHTQQSRKPNETLEESAKRQREERRLDRERRYQQAKDDVKRERAQQKQGVVERQVDTVRDQQQQQQQSPVMDDNSPKVLDQIIERKKERERRYQQVEEELKREKKQQAAGANVRRSASMRNEDRSGQWKEKSPSPPQDDKPASTSDRALERKREREQSWQQAEEEIKKEKEQKAAHNVRRSASMRNEDKRSHWKNEMPVEKNRQPSSPQRKPPHWQQAEEDLWRVKEQQQGHSSSMVDSTRNEEHSLPPQQRTPPRVAEKKSQLIHPDRLRDSNREARKAVETGQQILSRMEKKREERPTDEELERQAEEELRQINEERKKIALAEKERRKNTELKLMEKQRQALEEERRRIIEEKHRIHEQQRMKELADRRRVEQEYWQPQWGLLVDGNDSQQNREQLWQQIQQQVNRELEEEKHQYQHLSSQQQPKRAIPRQRRDPVPSYNPLSDRGYHAVHVAPPPTTHELPSYDPKPPRRQLSPVYRTASMKELPAPRMQRSNSEESLVRLKQSYDREIPKPPTLLVSPRKALANNKSSPYKDTQHHRSAANHMPSAAIPPTGFHHTYTGSSQKHKTRDHGGGGGGGKTSNFDSKSLPRSRQHRLSTDYDDHRPSAQNTPNIVPRHNEVGINWHSPTNRTSYPRSPAKRSAPSGIIPPAAQQYSTSASNTPSQKRHSMHEASSQRLSSHYPHHGSAAILSNGDTAESQSISYV